MNTDRFWGLIEHSRSGYRPDRADGNMDRQLGTLQDLLAELSSEEVKEFDDQMHRLLIKAYTWDLWGAATLLAGGSCSDDSFTDFRSWLVSLGRQSFEQAIADPDSLAVPAFAPGVEDIFFEEFQYAATQVYEEMTGEAIEDYSESYPDEPKGAKRWNNPEDLEQIYPKIWAAIQAKK